MNPLDRIETLATARSTGAIIASVYDGALEETTHERAFMCAVVYVAGMFLAARYPAPNEDDGEDDSK